MKQENRALILGTSDKPTVDGLTFCIKKYHCLSGEVRGWLSNGALGGTNEKRTGYPHTNKRQKCNQHEKSKPFHASYVMGHEICEPTIHVSEPIIYIEDRIRLGTFGCQDYVRCAVESGPNKNASTPVCQQSAPSGAGRDQCPVQALSESMLNSTGICA